MSTKIAIIGAGGMAAYHAKGFREAGAEIIALADVNAAAAEKAAARHGISRHFGDVGEMLRALPELDAVSIIVPNKFHAPLALQALQAGKHVFCEKPPALSAAEMTRMKAAAEWEKTGRPPRRARSLLAVRCLIISPARSRSSMLAKPATPVAASSSALARTSPKSLSTSPAASS